MAEEDKFGRKNLDFRLGDHQTDSLANKKGHYLEFYHVPSGQAVRFKAFVTQFEDQYSSNWSAEPVYGRMDPISTFERTGRVIQATFEVPAASVSEGMDNIRRISGLIKMLYPSYDGPGNAATMKSSPLVKVMFMNWIGQPSKNGLPSTAKSDGLLGWLAGINYVPLMENGVLFQDAGAGEYMYAKSFTISFQLTVLHEEQVGWDGNGKSATTDFSNSFYKFPYGMSPHYVNEGNYVKPATPGYDYDTDTGDTTFNREEREADRQANSDPNRRASNFVRKKVIAKDTNAILKDTLKTIDDGGAKGRADTIKLNEVDVAPPPKVNDGTLTARPTQETTLKKGSPAPRELSRTQKLRRRFSEQSERISFWETGE